MTKGLPHRRAPVHCPPRTRHDQPAIIFLTVCTDKKKPILTDASVLGVLLDAWSEARAWLVGRFVVMPDHVHLFCTPASAETVALGLWVRYWKVLASRQWPRPEEQPIWQRSFWDTQLRCGESYRQKWEYVRGNPVRAGLCDDPDAWPYQGEMNSLPWEETGP